MDRESYRKLTRRPALREALQSATSRQPPTRSQLEQQLAAAEVPEDMIDAIVADAAAIAKDVRLGQKPFHARAQADETAVKWLDRIDQADSLLPAELLGEDDDDPDLAERSAAEALSRQRSGIVGNPTLKQTSPPDVPWRQQR